MAAIAALHDDHARRASAVERIAERIVRVASGPRFAGVLILLIAAWMGANIAAARVGTVAIDPSPFPLLQDAIGVLALFLTVLILISQRREYALDERRAQLTLQLALLAEQKNAKIIEMLGALLTAHPDTHADATASQMAKPADSAVVRSVLEEYRRDL